MFVEEAGPARELVAVYGGRCRIELTVVNDIRIAAPYRLHERNAIHIGNTFLTFAH
jgi:hypothetical protein